MDLAFEGERAFREGVREYLHYNVLPERRRKVVERRQLSKRRDDRRRAYPQ